MAEKPDPLRQSAEEPQAPDVWTTIRFLSQSIHSRLGLKVAIAVFLSILIIETLILVPSYWRYEGDLLARLEQTGQSLLLSNFRSREVTDGRTIREYGDLLLQEPELEGGAIYRPDGQLLGVFGEPPEIAPTASTMKRRSDDGRRFDVIWRAETTGLGHDIVGRLDASWISEELHAFVLRVSGLVLLISIVVCGTTMLIVGHLILRPLLHLQRGLAAAEADPDRPERHTLLAKGNDELGAVVCAFNRMINTIAQKITEAMRARHDLEELNNDLRRLVDERTKKISDQAAELRRALNAEKELSGRQRQFVSMVGHEFRTPLAIIDGHAQRILRRHDKITADGVKNAGDKIRTAVLRLTELMESVLSAARLETGAVRFDPGPCSPKAMVREIAANHREVSPSHEIVTEIDRLPETFVMDEKLIRQALSNLVSNAIKYSRDGSCVWIRGAATQEGGLEISVRDEGIGIPAAEIEQVFERFFRASTSEGIAGTGIGLNMSKTLVEMHGGCVELASQEGCGTTLLLRLPNRKFASPRPEKAEAHAVPDHAAAG